MEDYQQIIVVVGSCLIIAVIIMINYHNVASTEELQSNSIDPIQYCNNTNKLVIIELCLSVILAICLITLPYKVEFIILVPNYFNHSLHIKPIDAFTFSDDYISFFYWILAQNFFFSVSLITRLIIMYVHNFGFNLPI
ncbi:Cornichon protein [Entamoeba marina]